MDDDFHYWGTYYAARVAGFKAGDCETICWAALATDYASKWVTKKVALDRTDFKEHPFETISTENSGDVVLGTAWDDTFRQIWASFHFPPGNYLSYYRRERPGHVVRTLHGKGQQQVFGKLPVHAIPASEAKFPTVHQPEDAVTREHFPIICRPNSDLAVEMIRDTMRRYHHVTHQGESVHEDRGEFKQNRRGLLLIGVRMHVFADSWAHQDHIGACDKEFNRRQIKCVTLKGGTWDGNVFTPGTTEDKGNPWSTQLVANDRNRTSAFWLGHGAMGHWPDEPFRVYRWQPGWSSEALVRNNPNEFLQAFVNLVNALASIKKGKEYQPCTDPTQYEAKLGELAFGGKPMATNVLTALRAIYTFESSEVKKRNETWKKEFSKTCKFEEPPEFVKDAADKQLTACLVPGKKDQYTATKFLETDYFHFHHATKTHYRFVRNTLRSQGFRLVFNNAAFTSSMVDDYEVLAAATTEPKKSPLVLIVTALADCYRASGIEETHMGLQMLSSDLKGAGTAKGAHDQLAAILKLKDGGDYKVGKETKVRKRLTTLQSDLATLAKGGDVVIPPPLRGSGTVVEDAPLVAVTPKKPLLLEWNCPTCKKPVVGPVCPTCATWSND